MTESLATDTPDALLKRIISGKRQRLRKNIHILFLGLSAEEADPIIALLRGARLAPRGKQVHSAQEFTDALGERAWDLILSPQSEGSFTAKEAIQVLQRLNKDIPVIQLVPKSTSQALLQGLKAKMSAVIALEEQELLLLQLRRQLEHLENRRRLKKVEAQLVAAEKQCQQLAAIAELPIAYLGEDRKPVFLNHAFIELFGLDAHDALQHQELDKFIIMKDRDLLNQKLSEAGQQGTEEVKIELNGRRVDGSNFLARFTLQHTRYLNQNCIQVVIHPDLHIASDSFADLDPITSLYDKHYMLGRLETAVQKALPGGADCSLLYIKFDNYSDLLGKLGDKGCDIILADLAKLVRSKINKAHICARLESDVFAVLFHDPSPDKALKLAEQLRHSIAAAKIDVTGHSIQTTSSIGVCTINDNAPHYLELIERARTAAEGDEDQEHSGNNVRLYEQQSDEHPAEAGDAAVKLIEYGLANNRFSLLYQPIVGLASNNAPSNYEIFLRLQDNDTPDEISPNIFLSSLENSETCLKMDQWVIAETFRKVAENLKEQQRCRVFITLTARAFLKIELLKWLQAQLQQYRIPADLIVFQVSESDMTTSMQQALQFSLGLKKLGCKLCIKHFGMSENSDTLRKKVRPDLVKLDSSYIQDLSSSAATDKAFRAMVAALAEASILTIAPMVEDARVMGKLWKSGVDYIQGYYLQPPGPEMNYEFFE